MRRWGITLGLMLLSAVALAAAPAPSATGTVWITLQPQPSGPLKAPRVRVEGKEVPTNPSGAFRVDGLAGGWVAIQASAEGYQPLERKVQLPAGGQTSVLLPLERIREPGTLRGRIIRQAGGAGAKVPLADVEVQLGGQGVARSDADGRFVLSAVGPGPVSLKLLGAGVRPQEEVVVIPPGGEASIEVALQKAEEVLAWMRGKVRSTQGQPLQATLKVAERKLKARTRPTGDFEFRLPAGRYQVTFEARGHIAQTKTVDVGAGDQALFYVDLSPLEN
ncbi:carboxypeptidase regulatory-like domain-containing protein [Hyalangium rubrum]|uniref:Carboxypeptidase regulatory-like domain-containing protein n=1 Tax=Hyalangium rubrum TaxID=3103134 RepID=A0ABU5HH32_9BACT|nr:carboxypeptidase regulatory-like domain-containing protein [Hyalangium sp. s54d21]MDY7232560.1 carboxypeptidase regulatory-like domain-containing protein [Hyalangium sp. s54d21]